MISGLLLIKWRWLSIFWFLSASSFAVFSAILLFLPETCRQVVGNGSHTSPRINQPLVSLLVPKKDTDITSYTAHGRAGGITDTANPLLSLTLLKCRSTALAIACYGIQYFNTPSTHACRRPCRQRLWRFTEVSGVVAGLSYIPFAIACIIASSPVGKYPSFFLLDEPLTVMSLTHCLGKILDYDYRRMTESLGFPVQRHQADEVSAFPVERARARLRISKYFILCCGPIIIACGWVLQYKQIRMESSKDACVIECSFCSCRNPAYCPAVGSAVPDWFHEPHQLHSKDLMIIREPGWCFVVFAALHLTTLPIFRIMEQ